MPSLISIDRISRGITRLADDRSGSIGLYFGLSIFPLLGLIGAAVDLSRWHSARVQTLAAMDAAVVAGTRELMETEGDVAKALARAQEFYTQNVASRPPVDTDTVSFRQSDTGLGVAAEGNATITTPFLNFFSVGNLPLLNETGADGSKAGYVKGGGGSNLEISLMLDVTGSMCDDGVGPCTSSVKLNALKEAAKRLVDTVVWEDQSKHTSRVALVPFSTRVRVELDNQGGPLMKKLTDLDPTWSGWYNECTASTGGGGSEDGGNWQCTAYTKKQYSGWKLMPCVTDRYYSWTQTFDVTDDAPGSGRWLNAHDGTRMTKGFDSSSTSPNSDNWYKTRTGATKAKAADHWNYNRDEWGGGVCADVPNANIVKPLSNDIEGLKAHVDGLEAFGSTSGALGTAWAWYMLSPKWDNVWTSQSRPEDYSSLTEMNENNVPKLRKVAVLMTDGVYNTFRGWKDQNQQTVSNAAKQMCTNMKAQGIEIFTVGFALDTLTPAERAIALDTLQACGTDIEHFYNTLDVNQLVGAFEAIASKVTTSQIVLTR